MKVKVDDPARLPDLMAALSARIDAVVTKVDDDELEVSLLGSQSQQAHAEEVKARLRAWGGGATVSGK